MPQSYNESHIRTYKGLDGIRAKASLYVGELNDAAHHHLYVEAVANAVDEYFAGRNKQCTIVTTTDNRCVVADESEGIPVGINPVTKVSVLTEIFTNLHTSGKFDNRAFKVSAGCFVGDTEILLTDGSTTTLLQLYKQFNPVSVYAYATSENAFIPATVYHVQLSAYVDTTIRITLSTGDTIVCTPDHPFYCKTEQGIQVIQAQDLIPTTILHTLPKYLPLTVQTCEVLQFDTPVAVYGISVTPHHNYPLACGAIVGNTHGLGTKILTALSTRLEVWTQRDNCWYHQAFSQGLPSTEVRSKKPSREVTALLGKKATKGTILLWEPDLDIIGASSTLNVEQLTSYVQQLSFLNTQLKFVLRCWDADEVTETVFYNKDRLDALVLHLAELHSLEITHKIAVCQSEYCDAAFTLALSDTEHFESFINSSRTEAGGKHVVAFWSALQATLSLYATKKDVYRLRDLKSCILGYLNFRVSGPKFSSQTKECFVGFAVDAKTNIGQLSDNHTLELERPEVAIEEYLIPLFTALWVKHKVLARAILQQASSLYTHRQQSKELLQATSKLRVKDRADPLPEVLYTATKAAPDARELMIVEGGSAFGCVTGDTEVLLADGTVCTFAELVGYFHAGRPLQSVSWDTHLQQQVVANFEEPHITKYTSNLVDVTFSDGTTLRCTPEHPILLADGKTYVAAADLIAGQAVQTV